ncbi:MAG: hypothetical protein IJW49_07740 [Clostridia bacterium]|nr:hypothetical protein [Clostridia bacterium]
MVRNDQQFLAQKIRAQYVEKEINGLDALKRADSRVTKPAAVLAYVLGTLGALVMGAGMSLVMTDLGTALSIPNTMTVGVATGVVGLVIALLNYPIYKAFLGRRRAKHAQEILAISDKILKD